MIICTKKLFFACCTRIIVLRITRTTEINIEKLIMSLIYYVLLVTHDFIMENVSPLYLFLNMQDISKVLID